jgi:hypothetical protein
MQCVLPRLQPAVVVFVEIFFSIYPFRPISYLGTSVSIINLCIMVVVRAMKAQPCFSSLAEEYTANVSSASPLS